MRERFADVIDEVEPLLRLHYAEIAWRRDVIPLAVDREAYLKMDESGALICFTAREGDVLAGYAAYFVSANPHYKTTQWAANDVIYVHPDYRGGTGVRLIKYCEGELRAFGVKTVNLHIKKVLDWGALAERLGYEAVDTVYQKWIGG